MKTSSKHAPVIVRHQVADHLRGLPQIKNIIAVSSAKGGVGKSTVTAQLALALQASGVQVGVFDADIYGPNLPQLLGPASNADVRASDAEPMLRAGLQTVSIADHIDDTTPMIWRGPMVSKAIQQLMLGAQWLNIDVLLVDMPPGTGDIQLTMAQKIPLAGALIVTTPESMAMSDARRGVEMFLKVHVPVLGLIENLSVHRCSACGHESQPFGKGNIDQLAKDVASPVLARLPMHSALQVDSGVCQPALGGGDQGLSQQLKAMAEAVLDVLAKCPKDFSSRLPQAAEVRQPTSGE